MLHGARSRRLALGRCPCGRGVDENLHNGSKMEFVTRTVYRFAAGQAERYPGLAAELVALPVELNAAGTPASVAAKRETEAIPIVVQTGDPVAAGLVRD